LGSNIAREAVRDFAVHATYKNHESQIPECRFMQMDILDRKGVFSTIKSLRPNLVIHTAGLVNVDYCEQHPSEAWEDNVNGTENVAEACQEVDAKMIYISTNAVFDGMQGMYCEEDRPHALSVYAKTKLEGERRVQHWLPESIIVRTAFYGWSLHNRRTLAEWVLNSLRDGTEIKMFTDAYFSPVLVNNLAEALLEMYRRGLTGTYHVDGSERCNKYEFGLAIARCFGLDEGNIEPSLVSESKLLVPRPKDISLDISKISKAISTKMLGVEEGITWFKSLEAVLRKEEIYLSTYGKNTKQNLIPYGHQWIEDSEIADVAKVLKTDWITQGPKVDEFESRVAHYCGAKYAVAVSSGTAALHAACVVAGISEGDEAITSPITFAATANAVAYCGGRPVFADIREDTLNIDPAEIRNRISPRTKAILPVDFAGHPADLDEIGAIAREFGLIVIEDAAHALGAEYKGKRIGGLSDMTILSFHPVKHITTGEGGMILTDNPEFYEKLRSFRHHGIVRDIPHKDSWYYEIRDLGYNYRLTDFQCALGIGQINKLDSFVQRRREIVKMYNDAFSKIQEIVTPFESETVKSSYHLYIIRLCLEKLTVDRKEIFKALQSDNIGVNVHYIPVHLHPYYRTHFGYKEGDYPKAEQYYEHTITLPIFPKMSDDDVRFVIRSVEKNIARYS